MKFSPDELKKKLPLPATEKWKEGVWDVEPFERSGVKLIYFAPKNRDFQIDHEEEEFYFIISGSGKLQIAETTYSFEAGDAFFVQAGVRHNFIEFTEDFATWAVLF